jgi:hypothetical protein
MHMAVHLPLVHAAFAFAPMAQLASSQAPQWNGSFCKSKQLAPQHVNPAWQSCCGLHPVTHEPPAHTLPAAQSASPEHSTHVCVAASHAAFISMQSLASLQPILHAFDAASHHCPFGH